MLTRTILFVFAALAALAGACSSPSPEPPAPPPTNPATLAAPDSGHGVQLKTPAFEVPAGYEIQNCYFFLVSTLEKAAGLPVGPLEVNRVQIVETPGSHHMNIFRVATVKMLDPTKGPVLGTNGSSQCFVSSNWSDWPLIANTQQAGDQDWSYPAGVANELLPTDWLMLQTHYVNATTQKTPQGGQVAANLWTLPADQVTAHLGTLFATNQNIRICQSNPTPTYSAACQFNSKQKVTIVGANGHFHSRGTEFDMFAWDGTSTTAPPESARFYQSLSWDDPPMMHSPTLELPVQPGGGVYYTCKYNWAQPPGTLTCADLNTLDHTKHMTPPAQQDCCYTFGGIVEENEHCNAFVYYYPKQDNVTCM